MRFLGWLAFLIVTFASHVSAQQPAGGQVAAPATTIADPRGPNLTPPVIRFAVAHVAELGSRWVTTDQMSESQERWWEKKGQKQYRQMRIDQLHPNYLIVWGSELENHAGVRFAWRPGTTSQTAMSGTATDQNGNRTDLSGQATTTTPGSLETVPAVRTLTHVHVYVFTWDDAKGSLEGPIWMSDRTGEGWGERSWNQTHSASQQLLDDALKFITSSTENARREEEAQEAARMATVSALIAKIHELAVANNLPAGDESACDQKISQQIGANKEMLVRAEQRDFSDLERLFLDLCATSRERR
ncbi:MAG: hypothetical protein WBM24_21860 [Candidatus Sulfotelmatobacter sp.]